MKAKDLKAGQRFECYEREYVYTGFMDGDDLICVKECDDGYRVTGVWGGHEVTLIDEVSKPSYLQRQSEWVEKHGLKVGDKVKVLRSAEYREGGWRDAWLSCMNEAVGKECVVDYVFSDGIRLGGDAGGYGFPYFVLEPVVAIDPGEGYRLLLKGDNPEKVVEGDQYLSADGEWRGASNWLMSGCQGTMAYRRKIEPVKPVDPGEGYRILGDDEVCKEGDQFLFSGGRYWDDVHSGVGIVVEEYYKKNKGLIKAVRRKKEPTYRPYTAKESYELLGVRVKRRDTEFCGGYITFSTPDVVTLGASHVTRERLLKEYTFQDGTPCGVEVK